MRIASFERRWFDAVARALLPAGALGGSVDHAHAPALFEEDAAGAPWHSTLLLRIGLWVIWFAPLASQRKTFGALGTAEREQVLEALLKSRVYVVRSAVLFVKLMVCSFVIGPATLEHLEAYHPPRASKSAAAESAAAEPVATRAAP